MYQQNYNISEMFSTFQDSLTNEQINNVSEAIEKYIHNYHNYKLIYDKKDVAHNYNLTITSILDSSLKDYKDEKITCKKGCSYCCSIHVEITDDQAILLLKYCKSENIVIDWKKVKKQAQFNVSNYLELTQSDRRCVFLSTKEECKVYEYRPVNCRLLLSVDKPKYCDVTKGIRKVKKYFNHNAEILGVAISNATETASMAKLLLKHKNNG